MSHGGGGGGRGEVNSDPNLTPLLDLVLQLVMFFMLVANFVMDELSDKIHLPTASSAKPITARDANIIFLNVSKEGKVITTTTEPMTTPNEIRFYMLQQARTFMEGEAKAKETMTVIIRADEEARFRDIHKTMSAIKEAGFHKLQLRAKIASDNS
jgi:biopolymer transport protein ExbD